MSERYFDRDGVYDIVINDYVSTSAIVYKLNKISDLEAKLAESEKSEETYKSMFEIGVENNHSLLKEIEQLKQQLAEKDEKIEKLKSENHALMSDNAYQEADIFELTQKFAIHNQDKISFAVEQLEKVKEFVTTNDKIFTEYYGAMERNILLEFINNQIKQLTHQHEDKGD